MPSAVIFGFGGTLVDNAIDQRIAVNKLLTTMGRRPITLFETQSMLGDGPEALIARALAATGPPASASALPIFVSRFLRFYRGQRMFTHTALYPGMDRTLDALANYGFRLAICSNNHSRVVLSILVQLGLDHSFSEVIGGDTIHGRKPSGSPVKILLKRLNITPPLAVMIGDRLQDIDAGRQAGLATVNVTYGSASYPAAHHAAHHTAHRAAHRAAYRAAHRADAVADSPESLPVIIRNLRKE